jgi:hypothetical protein
MRVWQAETTPDEQPGTRAIRGDRPKITVQRIQAGKLEGEEAQ